MKNYFSAEELSCTHCGLEGFDDIALESYNTMRHESGFPWIVTSAYRCKDHPIEKKKDVLGAHVGGTAMDVYYDSDEKLLTILRIALNHGVTRIGIHDDAKFIHMDFDDELPSPAYWQY